MSVKYLFFALVIPKFWDEPFLRKKRRISTFFKVIWPKCKFFHFKFVFILPIITHVFLNFRLFHSIFHGFRNKHFFNIFSFQISKFQKFIISKFYNFKIFVILPQVYHVIPNLCSFCSIFYYWKCIIGFFAIGQTIGSQIYNRYIHLLQFHLNMLHTK